MDKKKLTTIALFLAISTLFVVGQSVKKHVKAADEFMEKGKFEDARNQYSQAININPKDAELYTLRGKALNKMELHAEALEDFKRAAVFDEKDGDIYFYIGYTYNRLGQYDSAYTALNQASAKKTGIETIYSEKTFSLINLQRFDPALRVSDTALRSKERNSAYVFYQRGVIFENMKNMKESRDAYEDALKKDENYVDAHLALALLLVGMNEVETAMEHCNHVLGLNNKHTYANYVRSKVYVAKLEYPSAINDISKNILIEPNNPKHYIDRGIYYQEFTQHSNAINDFTKAISLDDKNPSSYLLRAKSYEEVSNYKDAARDYQKITSLSEYDIRARQLLDQANERIYEINREEDAPELVLETPIPIDNKLQIAGNLKEVILNGKIKDVSSLKSFTVNGEKVHYEGEPGEYKFIANVDIEFANKVEIVAVDTYMNKRVISLDIQRMETNAPIVKILAPYASDNNEIYLESNDPVVFLEGRLGDESPIKSIFIDGVTASYKVDELNPTFTATVNVANKTTILVEAQDIYGNKQSAEFKLNREGALISAKNPMGKTWVVFIENSKYESFASLDGPIKDINLMKKALTDYAVHNVIHKTDMDKEKMEKFFSIELRDMVRKNQVKSLLVWYAGHGKFINNVGYWIPVDASRDDEFTYFNINSLRASMQGYADILIHTLIITDACESGPSFYMAMRSGREEPNCGDWQATQFKSSQVFSSAGYELAVDDSQFTRTFASSLLNNPNDCIPIESIVKKVTVAVKNNKQQEPLFGKVKGLQDENGTFFFITKKVEE